MERAHPPTSFLPSPSDRRRPLPPPFSCPWQLRRVKSTVHLTGKPSAKTKQRMVDLLAPSKGEVIATTAIASQSRSSSYTDLASLANGGDGGGGGGGDSVLNGGEAPSYRGELREEEEDNARGGNDGWEDSVFGGGGSALGLPAGARRGALQKVLCVWSGVLRRFVEALG